MDIELYGIRQNLGICTEIEENDHIDLPPIEGIDEKKYKDFKKYNIETGVDVFRGIADAQLLASISQLMTNYQRKSNPIHKEKIKEYLMQNKAGTIYFPEVTLLYEFDDTIAPESLNIQSIINNYKDINIDLLSKLYATGMSILTLKEGEKLFRLDGNHRLEVLQEFAQGIKINPSKRKTTTNKLKNNRMISYCIILIPKSKHLSFEHLYFYLLNSKSLPITPLKNIDMLTKDKFFAMTDFIKKDPFLNIMNELKEFWNEYTNNEKESLIEVVQELQNSEENNTPKHNFQKIILYCKEGLGIYTYYKQSEETPIHKYIGVCCFIRSNVNDTREASAKLKEFKKWVVKYNHNITHFKKISDLYEAFKKYDENKKNKKNIFVAMQWHEKYVETYSNAIKDTITSLKGRYTHINLELMEIMNPKDGDNIINNIMDYDIPNCNIFLADFSTNNGNVLLEYGYARAKGKFMCLLYSKEWRNETMENLKKGISSPTLNNHIDDFNRKQFFPCKNHEYDDLKHILKAMINEEYIEVKKLITALNFDTKEKDDFISRYNDIHKDYNKDVIKKFHDDLCNKIFDLRMIKDSEWDTNDKLKELLEKRFEEYLKHEEII